MNLINKFKQIEFKNKSLINKYFLYKKGEKEEILRKLNFSSYRKLLAGFTYIEIKNKDLQKLEHLFLFCNKNNIKIKILKDKK